MIAHRTKGRIIIAYKQDNDRTQQRGRLRVIVILLTYYISLRAYGLCFKKLSRV